MKNTFLHSPTPARHECKYLVARHCPKYLETLIKLHPSFFHEIYQQRIINNLYFDNLNLDNYFANLDGIGYRVKQRLRFYTQEYLRVKSHKIVNQTSSPHFEIKIRSGDLISKKNYSSAETFVTLSKKIPPVFHPLFSINKNSRSINNLLFLEKASLLQPVILNSYTRKYFLSADKKVRITIDSDIRYHQSNHKQVIWNKYWQLPATIMEIKADVQDEHHIAEIAKHFPLPLTKSSKYVLGVMSCKPDIESPLYKMPVLPKLVSYDH